MPNISSIITAHNKRLLRNETYSPTAATCMPKAIIMSTKWRMLTRGTRQQRDSILHWHNRRTVQIAVQ